MHYKKQQKKVWRNTSYVNWFCERLKNSITIPKNFITMAEWCKRFGYTALFKIHLIVYKAHNSKNRTEYLDYVKKNTLYVRIKSYGKGGGIGFIKEDFPADGFTEHFQLMFSHKDYILLPKRSRLYLKYIDYLPKNYLLKVKMNKYHRYLIHKSAPKKVDNETIIINFLNRVKNKTHISFRTAYKRSGITRQAAQQKLQLGQVDECCKIKSKWYIPENNLFQLARRRKIVYV